MSKGKLFAFSAVTVFSVAALTTVATTSLARSIAAPSDTIFRSCPSGQTFDEASGTCKSFFDIRGSFAAPTPEPSH